MCALSSPTWSQAIPGCRSRAPELGCFSLPVCPEQQGSRAGSRARGCGQISAHARGSLPTAPHPKLCAETQTPPAHLYANTRQSTRTQPPAETIYTQTLTQPALQPWVCAQLTPEADSGFFQMDLPALLDRSSLPFGLGLPVFHLNVCVRAERVSEQSEHSEGLGSGPVCVQPSPSPRR